MDLLKKQFSDPADDLKEEKIMLRNDDIQSSDYASPKSLMLDTIANEEDFVSSVRRSSS